MNINYLAHEDYRAANIVYTIILIELVEILRLFS